MRMCYTILDGAPGSLPNYEVVAETTREGLIDFRVCAQDEAQATQKVLTTTLLPPGVTVGQVLTVDALPLATLPHAPGSRGPRL